MRNDWEDSIEGSVDSDEVGAVARCRRRGVRLPFCTWQGLATLVAVLTLGAIFVGEEKAEPFGGDEVTLAGHVGLIETLRFSADGRMLVTSGWDRTVRVWDMGGPGEEGLGAELARLSVGDEIYATGISPDGRTVAVAGLGGSSLWGWRDEGAGRDLGAEVGPNRSLAFSPDGRTLALGGFDHGIKVVDVKTGRVAAKFAGHSDVVRKLAFSADAKRLFSLAYDGTLKTWDLEAGREVQLFQGLNDVADPVLIFAMSPAGDRLALSRLHGDVGRVEIWDAARGVRGRTCEVGSTEAHALAFSRDGRILASSGADYRVRFWNPSTGQPAGMLEDPTGWVRALDFSADGRWMAFSSVPDKVFLKRLEMPNGLAASHAATTDRTASKATPGV